MSFYEEFLRYTKKERLYLTDENLVEFNTLVFDLKDKLILNALKQPSYTCLSLAIDDTEYPNLFDLLNKYEAKYTFDTVAFLALSKGIQENLNVTDGLVEYHELSVNDIFKVSITKKVNEDDDINSPIKALDIVISY